MTSFPQRTRWRLSGTEVVSLAVVVASLGLVAAWAVLRDPALKTQQDRCSDHLRHIMIALHNYHNAHGSFPPAYVCGDGGRAYHSWRVLILPFLEDRPEFYQSVYARYDFSEPFDGPRNSRLAKEFPSLKIYTCPASTTPHHASYLAVIGEQTMWPADHPLSLSRWDSVPDGLSETVMLVEVARSGIHWMEPRDLELDLLAPGVNPPAGVGVSSEHPDGAFVAFVDGSYSPLSSTLPAEALRELLLRDDAFQQKRSRR